MTNDKFIIPRGMRPVILERLHAAHQGVQRTKEHAQRYLYWPGMSTEIQNMVERCTVCQQLIPNNQIEPLKPHELPELPWYELGVYIF